MVKGIKIGKSYYRLKVVTPTWGFYGITFIIYMCSIIADKVGALDMVSLFDKSVLFGLLVFYLIGAFVKLRKNYREE